MRSTFETESEEYPFQSEIKVSTLDTWLEHCNVFVGECVINIDPEGFHVLAVGPAQVGMVETSLQKEAFESHRAGNDGSGRISVGIVLEKIQDVVDLLNKNDTVSMGFEQETGTLHLQGSGIKRSLALIQPSTVSNIDKLPDIDLPVSVTLPHDEFKRAVKANALVSDHVRINYYDGDSENRQSGMFLYSEGDNDDTLVEPADQQVHDYANIDEGSMFSVSYIEKIEKVVPKSGSVVVEVGDDLPAQFTIVIEEEIADETFPVIRSTFCVAPRFPVDR